MILSAAVLAAMIAIIAANIVWGPRGYRLLAEAGGVGRKAFYRRMLAAQLLQFTLPPVVGLLVLGRWDAVFELPEELWSASALLVGYPMAEPDPVIAGTFAGASVVAIPLGALLTWRQTRRGKGPPKWIGNISALLPRDRIEVIYGALISVAAGVGEELFFRLLLAMLLTVFLGDVVGVVAAILLFGLAHWYQGWKGVVATTLVGALITWLYLMSGSLLVAMLFHVVIDLMGLVIRPVIRGAWRSADPATD